MVSIRGDNIWLTLCSLAIFICGLARVASAALLPPARRPCQPGVDALLGAHLHLWRLDLFRAFSACNACWRCSLTDDPTVHLVVATMSTGLCRRHHRPQRGPRLCRHRAVDLRRAASVAGAHLPWRLAACRPRPGAPLLFIFAMIDITLSIREIIVQALVSTRDKAELADRFEEQAKRFDVALTNMSHGLCMFDGDNRLAVWNERFLEVTGLPAGGVHVGASVHDLVRLSVQTRQSFRRDRPARRRRARPPARCRTFRPDRRQRWPTGAPSRCRSAPWPRAARS